VTFFITRFIRLPWMLISLSSEHSFGIAVSDSRCGRSGMTCPGSCCTGSRTLPPLLLAVLTGWWPLRISSPGASVILAFQAVRFAASVRRLYTVELRSWKSVFALHDFMPWCRTSRTRAAGTATFRTVLGNPRVGQDVVPVTDGVTAMSSVVG
jgi:hypothetical protein